MSILDNLGEAPLPKIEDPRARFYLDNYRTIETWAALKREAATLLAEGLLDLGPIFEADSQHLGERIDVLADDGATQLMLRRPEWMTGVGIGLEWTRAVLDRQADVSLYAGLQHDATEISEDDQGRLAELAAAARPTLGTAWTSGRGCLAPVALDPSRRRAAGRAGPVCARPERGLAMLGGRFPRPRRPDDRVHSTGMTEVAPAVAAAHSIAVI